MRGQLFVSRAMEAAATMPLVGKTLSNRISPPSRNGDKFYSTLRRACLKAILSSGPSSWLNKLLSISKDVASFVLARYLVVSRLDGDLSMNHLQIQGHAL